MPIPELDISEGEIVGAVPAEDPTTLWPREAEAIAMRLGEIALEMAALERGVEAMDRDIRRSRERLNSLTEEHAGLVTRHMGFGITAKHAQSLAKIATLGSKEGRVLRDRLAASERLCREKDEEIATYRQGVKRELAMARKEERAREELSPKREE